MTTQTPCRIWLIASAILLMLEIYDFVSNQITQNNLYLVNTLRSNQDFRPINIAKDGNTITTYFKSMKYVQIESMNAVSVHQNEVML